MATIIKLKRGTSTPSTSDITNGEVAVDTSAKKIYINDSGTVKEIGGAAASAPAIDDVTDVSSSSETLNDILVYDGSNYVNKRKHEIAPAIPFTKADGTAQNLVMVNNRDMTTIQGFLHDLVQQKYHVPFTKSDGTSVTTMIFGAMHINTN